jgi:hypothetical protein
MSFHKFDLLIDAMKINQISDLLCKDFFEEAEVEGEKEKRRELSYATKSEKFRFDNSTAAKNRKSIDSSILMSNLSLSEVFEHSTDKKIFNKNNSLLPENLNLYDTNVILEEDSNFNMNTFSLNFKNNFGSNFDNLDFANNNQENLEDEAEEIERKIGVDAVTIEEIKDEVEKSLVRNSSDKKRKSSKIIKISIADVTERICGMNNLNETSEQEVASRVFYQLLISAQAHQYLIYQNQPFGEIFTK